MDGVTIHGIHSSLNFRPNQESFRIFRSRNFLTFTTLYWLTGGHSRCSTTNEGFDNGVNCPVDYAYGDIYAVSRIYIPDLLTGFDLLVNFL